MKNKKILLVMILFLPIILPLIKVDSAVTHVVNITNPLPSESFSYSTTDEVFTGYSITGGLVVETEYGFTYNWYIDSVEIDSGAGTKESSNGGVLILDDEFDTSVDVLTYDVGEHNCKLYVRIYVSLDVTDDHTHTWFRDEDPNNDPVITITAPATDYEVHNRTSEGNNYLVEWSVNDDDGTLVAMEIKFGGVSNKTWVNPAETSYSRILTCNSDGEYTILITCEDDDAGTDSETIHLTAITGSTGTILMLKPDGTRHSQPIDFSAQSDDLDGLNNLSVTTDQVNTWTITNHDNGTQFGADPRVFSDNSDAWGEASGADLWKRDSGVNDKFYVNDSVAGNYGQIYMVPEDEITFTDYDAWSVKLKGKIPTTDLDSFTLMVAGDLNATNDYWFKMYVLYTGSIYAGLSTTGGSKFEMIAGYWSEAGQYTVGDWITMELVFDLENSTVKYYFDDVLKKSSGDWFTDIYNATYTKRCNVANHNAAGKVENLLVDDFQLRVNNDNEVLQWIYTTSGETSQIDNWDIPSANWTDFYEGDFNLVFALGDDDGNIVYYTRTYTKDTVNPVLSITLPYNNSEWFVSEVPSLNYQLDWGGNDGDDTNELLFELNYNATNNVVVSWVVSETIPDRFPACDRKIVNSFGSYYVRMRAIDSAGNVGYSGIVFFEVFNERTISISCTSQFNSASIDVSRYLRFVVDGVRSSYEDIIIRTDEYEFVIEDVFGNELRKTTETYALTKSYQLPLRAVTFTNSLSRLAEYLIVQDDGNEDLHGFISSGGSKVVYLFDGEYDVAFAPINNKIGDGSWYVPSDRTIVTSSTAVSYILNCGTMELPGGGTTSVAERLDKVLLYGGMALAFMLLLIVFKGNVRNTGRFIKAKATRSSWRSVEDERIDAGVHRNKASRKREKDEEKKQRELKRDPTGGMPLRNPANNDEYRRRIG